MHAREPRGGRRRTGARLAWLLLALLPALAPAQESAELDVVRAALPHVRASLPAGAAALDPEEFCEARLVGWSCPEAFREAAESEGFRLGSRAFTLVCIGGPRTCRLVGAASLAALSRPEVSGDGATLDVTTWQRAAGATPPVEERRSRLTLARGPDGWEVVREDPPPRDQGS